MIKFNFSKVFAFITIIGMLLANNVALAKKSPPYFLQQTEKDVIYKKYLDNYEEEMNKSLKTYTLPESYSNYFMHVRYTIYKDGTMSDLKVHTNARNCYKSINPILRPRYRKIVEKEGIEFENIIEEIIIYTPRKPFLKEFKDQDLNIQLWLGYIPYLEMQGKNWVYDTYENGKIKQLNEVIFISRDINPK